MTSPSPLLQGTGLEDFRAFLKDLWITYLRLPEPTPIQNDIAHYLQHGPKRRVIMGFRGVAKTWITAAYVAWRLRMDPELKVLIISASQPLADDTARFIRNLIAAVPYLQDMVPRPGPGQTDSTAKFNIGTATLSKDPSVKSAGITGQITGSRADIIILDDVEIPKNAMTHLMRERLAEQVKECAAILKPDGEIIYLGTPQVEATLYNRLPRRGYEIRVWPAEIPESIDRYGGRLSPFILKLIELGAQPGTPTEPSRFSETILQEKRTEYALTGYALQFLLDPTPAEADRNPLKTRDLIVMDADDELGYSKVVWAGDKLHTLQDLESGGYDGDCYHSPAWLSTEMQPWQGTVMAIDPSGKGKDETGYAVVRHLNGMLLLRESGGFLDGYGEATLDTLAERAILLEAHWILVEENFGLGMYGQLLKASLQKVYDRMLVKAKAGVGPTPKHIPRIADKEEWNGWASAQKEVRILNTLQAIIGNHRLIVARRVVEADLKLQLDKPEYSLIYQMTRMSREKGCLPHEDRLDALAMACGYFEERMSRDSSRALHDEKMSRIDELVRKYEQHVNTPSSQRIQLGAPAPNRAWTRHTRRHTR